MAPGLLPQPCGFEGFVLGRKHPSAKYLPVLKLNDLKERGGFHRDATSGSFTTDAQGCDDKVIACRIAPLKVQPEPFKGVEPRREELPDTVLAAIGLGIWVCGAALPLDVGMDAGERVLHMPGVERLYRLAERVDVLLRHRLLRQP